MVGIAFNLKLIVKKHEPKNDMTHKNTALVYVVYLYVKWNKVLQTYALINEFTCKQ